MDDLLEAVLEGLFEFIFEVADGGSTSQRVPIGLRILAAVVVFLILGGAFGLIVFTGVMLVKQDGLWLLGILMFAIAAFMLGYLIFKFRKIFNRRG